MAFNKAKIETVIDGRKDKDDSMKERGDIKRQELDVLSKEVPYERRNNTF